MAYLSLSGYVPRAQRERLAAARLVPATPTEAAPPVAAAPSVKAPAAQRSIPEEVNLAAAALADPELAQFR